MKKGVLFLLSTVTLFSAEVRYGYGSMDFTGGFLGLSATLSEPVSIYSVEENHKNILSSNFFYSYNLTMYDSEHLKQMQQFYNTGVEQAVSWMPAIVSSNVYVPTIDYRIKGLDAAISIGYDLVHKGENTYIGIAPYLGINIPTIDSTRDSSSSIPDTIDTSVLTDLYKASETEITTYKLGVGVYSSYEIKKSLSLYLNGVFAYQTGSIKSNYLNSDFDVDGTYSSLDAGIKFSPLSKDYKFLGITLSPRLYMTVGAKYDKWKVKDVALDMSGMNMSMPKSDMSIVNKSAYVGVGYSF